MRSRYSAAGRRQIAPAARAGPWGGMSIVGAEQIGRAEMPPHAERRPSVERLAAALLHRLQPAAGDEAQALCTILAALLGRHLRFDAADPDWPDRDRVVLTAGLARLGDAAAALLGSGPGLFHQPGQPLGVAIGLALADRMLAARFGRSLVDHRSWLLGGEADLATGAVQEAAFLAGNWRLGRLTVIVAVSRADAPGLAGFVASNWAVRHTPATDVTGIESALSAAARSLKPTVIACLAGSDGVQAVLPEDSAADWVAAGRRSAGVRRAWLKRLARHAGRQDFEHALYDRRPAGRCAVQHDPAAGRSDHGRSLSTMHTVQRALTGLPPSLPNLVALPGDAGWLLPHSQTEPALTGESCGQLTQAASAAIAGLALHGGLFPFAAYRLASLATIQPALADAARDGLRLLLALVEPATPCPVTCQLSSLRAMRNVTVFRPSSADEALECLHLALRRGDGPSVLLLSDGPAHSPAAIERTSIARGGYVVADASGRRGATLVASGPEIRLAMEVRDRLAASGRQAAVVSLHSWTLFARQDASWRSAVLGEAPRIGFEHGSGLGWERWLGPDGLFVELPDGHDASALAQVISAYLERLGAPRHVRPLSTEHHRSG